MKKPTFEQVRLYCFCRLNTIDPQAFLDYYDSVGWMIGKKPMKDWQAAVRTWERRQKQEGKQSIVERMTDRDWAQ